MHLRRAWLIIGVGFLLAVAGCRSKEDRSKLHDRIVAANTSQYCRLPDACFNPMIMTYEESYDVTTFLGTKPQHAQVPVKELANYLHKLPMQAWPHGPSIAISRSDDVTDERAIERNFEAAQQVCRSMGLEVQVIPAG